jgi:hypothetical protein
MRPSISIVILVALVSIVCARGFPNDGGSNSNAIKILSGLLSTMARPETRLDSFDNLIPGIRSYNRGNDLGSIFESGDRLASTSDGIFDSSNISPPYTSSFNFDTRPNTNHLTYNYDADLLGAINNYDNIFGSSRVSPGIGRQDDELLLYKLVSSISEDSNRLLSMLKYKLQAKNAIGQNDYRSNYNSFGVNRDLVYNLVDDILNYQNFRSNQYHVTNYFK